VADCNKANSWWLAQCRTSKVYRLDEEPKEEERKSELKEISPPLQLAAIQANTFGESFRNHPIP
jgi:hypothetical protein